MNRMIGYVVLVLACVGLAGCVAGVIAIWVARPSLLESSDELFDALDDGLELVEQKTIQAAALTSKIQAGVAPIVGEVTELAEKADSRPEDEKVLNRIRGELSEHLGQVDALGRDRRDCRCLAHQDHSVNQVAAPAGFAHFRRRIG